MFAEEQVRRKAALEEERIAAIRRKEPLLAEIDALERKLEGLKKTEVMAVMAVSLTGYTMLAEDKIVAVSAPLPTLSGVYFLIHQGKIVYIGQSVCVPQRIAEHQRSGKEFDSCAYVVCEQDALDLLESMYIHVYQPKLNGDSPYHGKHAPYSLTEILERAKLGGKMTTERRLTGYSVKKANPSKAGRNHSAQFAQQA